MLDIKAETKNLQSLIRRIEKSPKALEDFLEKNFRGLGKYVAAKMRREMEPMKYTGATANSVSSELALNGARFRLTVGPTGMVAAVMQTGSSPHWVPIAPLKKWAYWKLGDERAAYAVQKSIARHGTSMYLEYGLGIGQRTPHGIGLDYPGRTLVRGDVTQATRRTANRIGMDLKAFIEDGGVRPSTPEVAGE